MHVFSSPNWGITYVWQVIVAGMIHEIKEERDGQKKGRWIYTSNKLRLDSGICNQQHVTSLRSIVANCGLMNVCLGEEPGVTVWQLKPKRVVSMICSAVV